MNKQLSNDLSSMEAILEQVTQHGLEYLQNIHAHSTSTEAVPEVFEGLQQEGIGAIEALKRFNARWAPVLVAASGPRYWGFVTGGTTPAAIAGDWLTTVYDQNTQAAKGYGDISAALELETIRLLLALLELPENFLGGFVTGATMSNFTCLAVARQWLGSQAGLNIARDGISDELNILTATPHSSSIKSLALLGIGSANILSIKTGDGNRESIDISDLENRIRQLNGQPFLLISSAGTVNTADFDDFPAIAALKNRYHFWWHIDAAFGGFAILSDRHRHLLKGWEQADSITVDCHKWLNVPYENAVFFIKEQHRLLQVITFQNSNAPYLGDPLENFNYLNLLPENSRRLKALPVWLSLNAYGRKGYQSVIRNCILLAERFGAFIARTARLRLMAPVRLNTVCFTLAGANNYPHKVSAFLSALNKTGKVFMSPTLYKGQPGIRAAFVNFRTTEKDIAIAEQLILEILEQTKDA
ncbi:amino acid decarboxylase [Niabella ginsenosidivorans]|uniref:Amino acid decarboxylase n=1 Tax=Niabella ginsenosidivorans TaxID=1176587 RepID=A0A1A9HWU8_9BACT|nr:pyridoxal-dependent decarboxylase [Niabella ginsenosidivorans]ANH79857.1 amino acid decarboxylase [Niabella ginsenosidivorans]